MSAEQLRDQIIQKSWEDAEFKKKLITNPKAAVKEALGIDIPDTIELNVLEESDNKFYLVLPQSPVVMANTKDSDAAAWD